MSICLLTYPESKVLACSSVMHHYFSNHFLIFRSFLNSQAFQGIKENDRSKDIRANDKIIVIKCIIKLCAYIHLFIYSLLWRKVLPEEGTIIFLIFFHMLNRIAQDEALRELRNCFMRRFTNINIPCIVFKRILRYCWNLSSYISFLSIINEQLLEQKCRYWLL